MKRIVFFVVLTSLGLSSCSSDMEVSPGNRTTMEVDDVFDAGEVIQGEFVTAKFKVTNTGDYPLVIADVKVGCKCTLAEKPEEPIAPGKSGMIMAQVDTDNAQVGPLEKTISIVSNADPAVKPLKIKAIVKRK